MVWLKLFKVPSFEAGHKPGRTVFGLKKDPLFKGYERRKIRFVFNATKLKHFYKKQDIIPNPDNPYHKLPTGTLKHEKKRAYMMSKYRVSIAEALEKTEKYRKDAVAKKKLKGLDLEMQQAYLYLAGKYVSTTITERKTEDDDEDDFKPKKTKQKKVNRRGVSSQMRRKTQDVAVHYKEMGLFGEINDKKKKKKSKEELQKTVMTVKEYKEQKKEKDLASGTANPANSEEQKINKLL